MAGLSFAIAANVETRVTLKIKSLSAGAGAAIKHETAENRAKSALLDPKGIYPHRLATDNRAANARDQFSLFASAFSVVVDKKRRINTGRAVGGIEALIAVVKEGAAEATARVG